MINSIPISFSSSKINNLLKEKDTTSSYKCFFNQNENFFIELESTITIPSFPIHHDHSKKKPDSTYIKNLGKIINQIKINASEIFSGLTWFFNPRETLKPSFFQIYKIGEVRYIYMLTLDLTAHPRECKIINRGDNDSTAIYTTNRIFMTASFIPLYEIKKEKSQVESFLIKQEISQTWIGETGRGYFVMGIWIDHELSKFFSKLIIPEKKKHYPYFPYSCKYKTITHDIIQLDPEGRRKSLRIFHQTIPLIRENLILIQKSVKLKPFSKDLREFIALKRKIPPTWNSYWDYFKIKAYLNDYQQKEYKIEFDQD